MENTSEQWRPVDGWPYEVSNLGRVRRSLPGRHTYVGRISERTGLQNGYPAAILTQAPNVPGRRKRTALVHILVCAAFHGPRPSPAHQVAHNDGCKTNNTASNLRWATAEENQADRVEHGTSNRGSRNGRARLTDDIVAEIRAAAKTSEARKMLRMKYRLTTGQMSKLLNGVSWRHTYLPTKE